MQGNPHCYPRRYPWPFALGNARYGIRIEVGDVDPRDNTACHHVSDKARPAIGGGILEAILGRFGPRPATSAGASSAALWTRTCPQRKQRHKRTISHQKNRRSGMAIGQSKQRLDAEAKVTGRARYTDDMGLPGMRHAAYVRSTIAHGMVLSIDASEALALPGVEAVFTADDVPGFLFPTARTSLLPSRPVARRRGRPPSADQARPLLRRRSGRGGGPRRPHRPQGRPSGQSRNIEPLPVMTSAETGAGSRVRPCSSPP